MPKASDFGMNAKPHLPVQQYHQVTNKGRSNFSEGNTSTNMTVHAVVGPGIAEDSK